MLTDWRFEAASVQALAGGPMAPETIFRIQLVLGYVAWLLCFGTYVWPRLRAMDRLEAQRAIASLHSFRFLGICCRWSENFVYAADLRPSAAER
jgi:hypothetical protein